MNALSLFAEAGLIPFNLGGLGIIIAVVGLAIIYYALGCDTKFIRDEYRLMIGFCLLIIGILMVIGATVHDAKNEILAEIRKGNVPAERATKP